MSYSTILIIPPSALISQWEHINPVDMFPSTFLTTLDEQSPFKLLVQLSIPDGKTLKSGYIQAFQAFIQKLHVISTLRTPHALSFMVSRIENTQSLRFRLLENTYAKIVSQLTTIPNPQYNIHDRRVFLSKFTINNGYVYIKNAFQLFQKIWVCRSCIF